MNTYLIATDDGPFTVKARSILDCVPQFRVLISELMRDGSRLRMPFIQSIRMTATAH